MIKLYSYYRSSAAYRVRIGLNLKGLSYDYVPVHLLKEGGQQLTKAYQQINPQQLIPTLEDENGIICQSLAILEYLEERYPNPSLLPSDLTARAWVRGFALAIACDIHPMQNLRVGKYLMHDLSISDAQKKQWVCHWVQLGFNALETQLANNPHSGDFCCGAFPTFADVFLVPQVYSAKRFEVPLEAYPRILRVYEACLKLQAFIDARPEAQVDYEA